MSKLLDDPRIDPRIKATLGMVPSETQLDAKSRDEMVAEANSAEALARMEQMKAVFTMMDNEQIAPSAGLSIATHQFVSSPDGNTIQVQFIRPESRGRIPACTTSTAAACR